jgi:hypothetical protein
MMDGPSAATATAWIPHPDIDVRTPVESWPDDVFANPMRRRGPLLSARYVELISRAFSVFAETDDERDVTYARLASAARYYGVDLHATSWKDLLAS